MKSAPYVYNEAIKIVEPSAGELAMYLWILIKIHAHRKP